VRPTLIHQSETRDIALTKLGNFLDSKPVRFVYGIVLPICQLVFLLGTTLFNSQTQTVFGFIIRLLLCLWFCGLYIKLTRLASYSHYPNIKWTRSDVGPFEKYILIGLALFFSLGCGLVTWWAIRWFAPGISNFAWGIALINAVIIFLPLVARYWALKI